MSFRELLFGHRHKVLPLVVFAAIVVTAFVYRRELTRWMTVDQPSVTDGIASAPKPTASPPKPSAAPTIEHVHLSDGALARLRAAFETYEQIRAVLARDTLDGLDVQAQALGAALDSARTEIGAEPAPIEQISVARRAAESLAKARDIGAARAAFGELSQALVTLAAMDPRLSEGWHVFSCPMVKGFQKWFQRADRLENPYMGQQMLECGSSTAWQDAPPPEPHASAAEGDDEIAYYTCSMHPSVRKDGPGQCPICSMELIPVTRKEAASGSIIVDEVRRQRIGVRTAPVKERPLTLKIRAVGKVEYDETRLSDVNLRMSGWVQKLLVEETGQRVRRGQTLFTLYSPELYAAQLEHLAAMRGGDSPLQKSLGRASHQRLRLLGMSEAQITEVEKRGEALEHVPVPSPSSGYVIEKSVVEGARVEAGMSVYRIADLSRVWVDLDVYESDVPHVSKGQNVEIELPYVPGKTYAGKVDYIYPALDRTTRTGRVRVVLENPELSLKPDMYANARIVVELGPRLVIPASAVIYTGPRRLVFVDLGEGRLRPVEVELGASAEGFFEIRKGLKAGDVVVTSGNFLIAAESRIRSATEYWGGGDLAGH